MSEPNDIGSVNSLSVHENKQLRVHNRNRLVECHVDCRDEGNHVRIVSPACGYRSFA